MSRKSDANVFRLLAELQSTDTGLTIDEIADRLGCSRRTAHRLLSTVKDLFFDDRLPWGQALDWVDPIEGEHANTRRWRIKRGHFLNVYNDLTQDERVALRRAVDLVSQTADPRTSGALRSAIAKFLAASEETPTATQMNVEDYLATTGWSVRAGVVSDIAGLLLEPIEKAIISGTKIRIRYRRERTSRTSSLIVNPLGITHHRFSYLIGQRGSIQQYRLDLIQRVDILTGQTFNRPKDFDIQQWAMESFGVYHGDAPIRVVLEFAPEVESRVRQLRFHPTQEKIRKRRDGSLLVAFTARGHREIIHEIMHPDWLGKVRIVEPDILIREYQLYINHIKSNHYI